MVIGDNLSSGTFVYLDTKLLQASGTLVVVKWLMRSPYHISSNSTEVCNFNCVKIA